MKLTSARISALVRVPTFWKIREVQGMSGNSVLTGMSGNCQGILLFVWEFCFC